MSVLCLMFLTEALLVKSSVTLFSSPLVNVVTFLTICVVIRLVPSSFFLLVFVDSMELPSTSVERRFLVRMACRLSVVAGTRERSVTMGGPMRALVEAPFLSPGEEPRKKSLLEPPVESFTNWYMVDGNETDYDVATQKKLTTLNERHDRYESAELLTYSEFLRRSGCVACKARCGRRCTGWRRTKGGERHLGPRCAADRREVPVPKWAESYVGEISRASGPFLFCKLHVRGLSVHIQKGCVGGTPNGATKDDLTSPSIIRQIWPTFVNSTGRDTHTLWILQRPLKINTIHSQTHELPNNEIQNKCHLENERETPTLIHATKYRREKLTLDDGSAIV